MHQTNEGGELQLLCAWYHFSLRRLSFILATLDVPNGELNQKHKSIYLIEILLCQ